MKGEIGKVFFPEDVDPVDDATGCLPVTLGDEFTGSFDEEDLACVGPGPEAVFPVLEMVGEALEVGGGLSEDIDEFEADDRIVDELEEDETRGLERPTERSRTLLELVSIEFRAEERTGGTCRGGPEFAGTT